MKNDNSDVDFFDWVIMRTTAYLRDEKT